MKVRTKKMVKNLLVSGCLLMATLASASGSQYFPDVSNEIQYSDSVTFLYEMGISQGDLDGNFNPNSTLTRGEYVTMLSKMVSVDVAIPEIPTFSDVPKDHWAFPFVEKSFALGMVYGNEDGTFGIESAVSVQDGVTILLNCLSADIVSEALSLGGYPNGYLETAKNYGLMENITSYGTDPLQRWEVANLLSNTFQMTPELLLVHSVGTWNPVFANEGKNMDIAMMRIEQVDGIYYYSEGWYGSEYKIMSELLVDQAVKTGVNRFEVPISIFYGGNYEGEIQTVQFDYSNIGLGVPEIYDGIKVDGLHFSFLGTDLDFLDNYMYTHYFARG